MIYNLVKKFCTIEEKKLAGPLAKKEMPAEECSRRNGKREESSRQKKIQDDKENCNKWTVWRL